MNIKTEAYIWILVFLICCLIAFANYKAHQQKDDVVIYHHKSWKVAGEKRLPGYLSIILKEEIR